MGKITDLTGKVYSRLTVLYQDLSKPTDRGVWWICRCICGNICSIKSNSLIQQLTKSCGCFRKESTAKRSINRYTSYGETNLRIHRIWGCMIQRCKNPSIKNYGKRGITVCSAWQDYMTFKLWAMSAGYTDTLSIDRIDVNGGYFPENCRWVDSSVQARNKRKSDKASSVYYGVHRTPTNTFKALVQIKNKKVFCKTFSDEIAAAKARDNYIVNNGLSWIYT